VVYLPHPRTWRLWILKPALMLVLVHTVRDISNGDEAVGQAVFHAEGGCRRFNELGNQPNEFVESGPRLPSVGNTWFVGGGNQYRYIPMALEPGAEVRERWYQDLKMVCSVKKLSAVID
jgi:hypothetical protein